MQMRVAVLTQLFSRTNSRLHLSPISTMSSTDYATVFGYHSIPAAVVLAIVYLPLFAWFIRQSIKNTTYVYISLSVFCLIRIVAFILRAMLIASKSLGENLGVFIADEIMFGVGFFALLYSAFTLVLDREIVSEAPPVEYGALQILRNRRLFRIALIVGVVLGIMGTNDSTSSNPSTASSGTNLRRSSLILFLVLTLIQSLQTGLAFTQQSRRAPSRYWADRHGKYILALISLFLVVREVFLVATISNFTRQNEEVLWYPFVALPEVLAVMCYSMSGLVPARADLQAFKSMEYEYGMQP
ncbi:hypothetical protein MSAN_00950800 [Mycena sanguinolenta]|uniref:DUF7702 domain-containing protein n=1 Tax=Mycena sanguinolenta TaxID=230812 RepID=A0A8H6YZ38_9AGAR|nr:hypothetical protein MSAN_00950800 [Mycena sanguinolenta]